jgi:ATP adenylyltransferase
LKKALKPKGFNIGINIGEVASASIEHIHIHVVPRFGADAGFMEIFDSTKVMPEPLEKTYKKLKKFSYLLE